MPDPNVVVVGAGGAGLAAAIEAHEAGARPVVLEAADRPGGSTAMSAGVVLAADTPTQAAAGISDDVDAMYRDYMAMTHWLLQPRLVRALCEGAHDVIGWLEGLGVVFAPEGLHDGGVDRVPRSHLPAPTDTDLGPAGGAAIVAALLAECARRDVEIRTGVRVTGLLREGAAVGGVTTDAGEEVPAAAVVIATGGFGASPELLAEHFPRALASDRKTWYLGTPHARGDGLGLGLQAGAQIEGHDLGVVFVTPGFREAPDGFFPSWLIFVNERGSRFIDESAPYSVLHDAVIHQPGSRCWAILDHEAFSGAGDDPALSDPYGYGVEMAGNWSSAMLAEQLGAGRIKHGTTLAELAAAAGIEPDGLGATVAAYNAAAAAGEDPLFAKSGPMLTIDSGPFYAVEMAPEMIAITFTGLRVDAEGHVLAEGGTSIPGLLAAGETTGGIQGIRYGGSGASVATSLVFGRRAGRAAARADARAGAVERAAWRAAT